MTGASKFGPLFRPDGGRSHASLPGDFDRACGNGREARPFFTFPESKLQLSRTMKTNDCYRNLESCHFGVEADTGRSSLSELCDRTGKSQSHQLDCSQGLFHFRLFQKKTSARCKNLKQSADSQRYKSKFESWFVGVNYDALNVHDLNSRWNAVSGSETKFFLDSLGQRNYHDRKFSGDNSVSAVSAFFHLHAGERNPAELSPFRFESLGDGKAILRARYFVRLEEAESRKRRLSKLSKDNQPARLTEELETPTLAFPQVLLLLGKKAANRMNLCKLEAAGKGGDY